MPPAAAAAGGLSDNRKPPVLVYGDAGYGKVENILYRRIIPDDFKTEDAFFKLQFDFARERVLAHKRFLGENLRP